MLLTLQHRQGDQHGLSEGRAKAELLARTSIAPLLSGHDLRSGLTATERAALQRSVSMAVKDDQVLRLRLRDLDGHVVFADDGSTSPADDEALDAAEGRTVVNLSRLNADAAAKGSQGPGSSRSTSRSAAQSGRPVGVLEVYLPYAPIASDIMQGQRSAAWPSSAVCCSSGSACSRSRPR